MERQWILSRELFEMVKQKPIQAGRDSWRCGLPAEDSLHAEEEADEPSHHPC